MREKMSYPYDRLLIKWDTRLGLENYLSNFPRYFECGGFLLMSRKIRQINDFIPIPNISDKPRQSFRPPPKSKDFANKYAGSKRKQVVAFFHSHPTPCIMSAGDLTYANHYQDLVFVTISPLKDSWNTEYIWYACRGVKPVKIKYV